MENNKDLDRYIETLRMKNAEKPKNSQDYEVGYGKPPKNTQFKKGQSGNRLGRKKKPLPLTLEEAIKLELNKEMTLTNKNGVKEKTSYFTLLARSLVQDAIKNDGPSRKILLQSKNILKCNIPETVKYIDERNYPQEDYFTDEQRQIIKGKLYKMLDNIASEENS